LAVLVLAGLAAARADAGGDHGVQGLDSGLHREAVSSQAPPSLGARLLAPRTERLGGVFLHPVVTSGAVQASARLGLAGDGAVPEYYLRNADNPDEAYALGGQQKYAYITGSALKWSTLVSWRYNPANQSTQFSQSDILAAFERATAKWSAVCNVRFSYAGTTSQNPSMSGCDGANIVGWAPLSGGTVGRTQACFSYTNLTEFDMQFDNEQPYQLSSLGLLESVAAHEFGHALGLAHTSVSPAVMTSSVTTGTLVQDDIDGCVSLYGPAQSSTPTVPSASLSKASVAFASQLVGTSSPAQTVRLTNTGGGSLTLSGLSIGGAHPSDFGRAGTCSTSTSLASGQYCDMTITFTPLATGTRSASLVVSSNATGSPHTVALSGTGAAQSAVASLSVDQLSYGSIAVATTSGAKTVRLSNSGDGTLSISSIGIGGTNPGDFARSGCAAGTSLAAGAYCDIAVTFTPSASGSRSAMLSIGTNASAYLSNVALSGSGVTLSPAVSLSGSALAFGDQAVGTISTAKSLTLTNTGGAALTISSIAKSGTNSAEFIVGGSCPASGTLAAGASCTVQAQFAPVGSGSRSASVIITTNAAGSPHAVNLSGNGVAAASPSPTPVAQPVLSTNSLVFGAFNVGTTSGAKSVTLSNTGSAALTLSSVALQGNNPGDFGLSGTCVAGATVAAGASCTSSVTFMPTAAGTRAATIAYSTSAGALGVSLSGDGLIATSPAIAKYSTTALTFADQKLGSTSRKRSISLTNAGSGTLLIQQVTLGGSHARDFAVSGNCTAGRVLGAKQSCSFSITFTPSDIGLRTADIAVLTSASATAQRLALSGNGTTGSASAKGKTKAAVADVVEYYHPDLDHYFVTAFDVEIEALDAGKFPGWVRTGQLFGAGYSEDGSNPSALAINSITQTALVNQPSLTPVCRLYGNPARGLDSHFYSASPAECSQVLTRFPDDWLLESEAALHAFLPTAAGVCPAGTTAVYRMWNQRADVNHRYTTDQGTRSEMLLRGWVPEGYGPDGVAMCIPAD
jgi:hypothetical protein